MKGRKRASMKILGGGKMKLKDVNRMWRKH